MAANDAILRRLSRMLRALNQVLWASASRLRRSRSIGAQDSPMKNLCRVLVLCCAIVTTATGHSTSDKNDAIAHYSDRAVELLRDAISRETAQGRGLVPAYAESLKQVFLEAGFSPEALTIVPYGETASLVVRYEGDGSSGRKPILFSSHMDVVPADPESWLRHPFELQEDETFFYGRG